MKHQVDEQAKAAILTILSIYPNLNLEAIEALIDATANIGGVSFIAIKGYSSDKSDNTELRDYVFNIGANYINMIKSDLQRLQDFDVTTVNIADHAHRFETVDFAKLGVTVEEYTEQVRTALSLALAEMIEAKLNPKGRTSNVINLTRMLGFNTNTQRLSIFGQAISSKVTKEGEYKKTGKAAKTMAKEIITKAAGLRSGLIKTLCLDNVNSTIKIAGDTLEIAAN